MLLIFCGLNLKDNKIRNLFGFSKFLRNFANRKERIRDFTIAI